MQQTKRMTHGAPCSGARAHPGPGEAPHGNAELGPEAAAGSRGAPHVMEWFQKTQAGLVRSSVSSRASCTRTGRSRGPGSRAPSLCTVTLTTGVFRTGRFGTLQAGGGKSTRKRA